MSISFKDLDKILKSFAANGFIFSNEQDFQFEFAKELRALPFVLDVKLEALSLTQQWSYVETLARSKGKLSKDIKEYTDIVVKTNDGKYTAIELKYKTPDKICIYSTSSSGNVITMVQGAADINSYEYILDISRLENINKRFFPNNIIIEKGYAILLTNYYYYRYNAYTNAKVWKNYSLLDGRTIKSGTELLFNNNERTHKVKQKTYDAIKLYNGYTFNWKDYSLVAQNGNSYDDYSDKNSSESPGFSYLINEVIPI